MSINSERAEQARTKVIQAQLKLDEIELSSVTTSNLADMTLLSEIKTLLVTAEDRLGRFRDALI